MLTHHFAVAIVAGVVSSASAGTAIHVDVANCPGPGSGAVGDPYCSIQTAIDNAADTDEIIVSPGTYFENVDFLGKAITLRSATGPEATIINAAKFGAVITCENGEGPDSVLKGFTLTAGAYSGGGGMRNLGSSPTVIDCIFFNNQAVFFNGGLGGGMYNDDASPMVIGCTFRGNTAGVGFAAGGGAMYNHNSSAAIVNCLFDANVASGGGGILNSMSTPTVIGCTLSGNLVGGIVNSASDVVVTNCVLWGNAAVQIADAYSGSSSTVSYCNVQGGWAGAGSNNIDADPLFGSTSNCCVPHELVSGCDDPGCEAAVCGAEPFCCDFWDVYCANLAAMLCAECPNDYHLSPGSPSIDAGDNAAVPGAVTADLDGNPRFLDVPETPDTGNGDPPLVDMGAYESLGGGCLALTSQETVCHADGTTFTLEVAGVSLCTGDTVMATFTGSGGAAGEEMCFTATVDHDGGGFCCSSQICVTVPNCTAAQAPCPWDCQDIPDGVVGVADLLELLGTWGLPGPCDSDGGGITVVDLLKLLGRWGPCP